MVFFFSKNVLWILIILLVFLLCFLFGLQTTGLIHKRNRHWRLSFCKQWRSSWVSIIWGWLSFFLLGLYYFRFWSVLYELITKFWYLFISSYFFFLWLLCYQQLNGHWKVQVGRIQSFFIYLQMFCNKKYLGHFSVIRNYDKY